MTDPQPPSVPENDPAALEKSHFERIHDAYVAHYFDAASMAFRRCFVYDPLFQDMDLNGMRVADLACGSGYNSVELLQRFPTVRVHGFDISERACADYRRLTGFPAQVGDLTRPLPPEPEPYDVVMIIGGLHHCATNLDGVLDNVARLLRPGGLFLMYEPNRRCFLEGVRRFWYRQDRYFLAEAEAALDHGALLERHQRWFRQRRVRHMGGPAYYLIYNSLVLRVPLGVKPLLWPLLKPLELLYNLLPGPWWFPYFIACWERTPEAAP